MTTTTIPTQIIPDLSELVAEGKTKLIYSLRDRPNQVLIVSKDDITAGDGKKHDILTGKAAYATQTTCNVFRILKVCGLPVAFDEQVAATSFTAPRCAMLPFEVVVRREAHGSYLKRMPGLPKGHLFPQLLLEFYLKTSGKKWEEHDLPCDDPLIRFVWDGDGLFVREIQLFNPALPIATQQPFLILQRGEVFAQPGKAGLIKRMESIAKQAFLVLEKCWQLLDRTLVDFKVEFGMNPAGELLLADVIDNDSWRVLENGAYIDKQVYRDGGALDAVIAKYAQVAALTDRFGIPTQKIIIWVGSPTDNRDQLAHYITDYTQWDIDSIPIVVCSAHKQPVEALALLNRHIQEVPDSVIIALIGRSNGAGPMLSAGTTAPVITLPANYREFPDDVWSSLRTPSDVPVMTVLEPKNAALAAINILALRNPHLYMLRRERVEERLVNTVRL